MKAYKTTDGIILNHDEKFYVLDGDWDEFINKDDVFQKSLALVKKATPLQTIEHPDVGKLLPPIGNQEIWASGVTYMRSKEARVDESKDHGGGSFYDRVYEAPRPELFFKSTAHRTVGHGQAVRIRKDSKWNVPEPELTLMVTSSAKIIGYTVGNDMSSRDIEGENPLYLPQAKTYNHSAAIGPCIYLTETPLPASTKIMLEISRNNKIVFSGDITIDQIKRKFSELVEYLYRELTFPFGCLLMTGTGIIPPNNFTLESGDVISITIEPIGTLVNYVA